MIYIFNILYFRIFLTFSYFLFSYNDDFIKFFKVSFFLRGRRLYIVLAIALVSSLSISLFALYSFDNPEFRLKFIDDEEKAVSGADVTIYADFPDGSTKIVAHGKTDGSGVYRFRININSLVKPWLDHEKAISSSHALRLNSVGLVYHIVNPLEDFAWTGIIEIPVHNPPRFSKSYTLRIGKSPIGISKSKSLAGEKFKLNDFCFRWRHEQEVADSHNFHGRFSIARFETDSHSTAQIGFTILQGQVWRSKMWFGYSTSQTTQLASGAKWSGAPTRKIEGSDGVSYNGLAVLSIELTFHYEKIYHRIWNPQCGTIAEYYEYRVWHQDVDFNSLDDADADYYLGDYYEERIGIFAGQGTSSGDLAYYTSFAGIDIDNKRLLNIALSPALIADLYDIDPNIPSWLLSSIGITVDVSDFSVGFVVFFIWADEGYVIDIFFKYLRNYDIVFAIGYSL